SAFAPLRVRGRAPGRCTNGPRANANPLGSHRVCADDGHVHGGAGAACRAGAAHRAVRSHGRHVFPTSVVLAALCWRIVPRVTTRSKSAPVRTLGGDLSYR